MERQREVDGWDAAALLAEMTCRGAVHWTGRDGLWTALVGDTTVELRAGFRQHELVAHRDADGGRREWLFTVTGNDQLVALAADVARTRHRSGGYLGQFVAELKAMGEGAK